MRGSILYLFGTAALLVPVYAVPLAMTTVVDAPLAVKSLTLALNGPSEMPNLPMPTDKATTGMMKTWTRPPRIPRGPTFRQADYGVSPNVTLESLAPVQGVEATPSSDAAPASHSRRSSEDYWEANHLSADDYSYNSLAEADAPQSAPISGSPSLPDPSDVSDDAGSIDTGDSSTDASGSPLASNDPVGLADPTTANKNHLPVHPDLSAGSLAIAQIIKVLGGTRYSGASDVHQGLGTAFGNSTSHTLPSPGDVNKAHMDVQKANQQVGHSVHRRVLRPATFITDSAPVRRMNQFARDFIALISRHSVEFNTESLLPTDPNSLNMSNSDVAREAARKHNIGVVNIDSNRAAPPAPPHPKINSPVPLNTTNPEVNSAAKNATDVTKTA